MFKITESIITSAIFKWSKQKTTKVFISMFLLLIVIGYLTLKVDKSIIIFSVFPVITLFVVFYVKTIATVAAKEDFDRYRKKWNNTFKDNSFDNYFSIEDYFDFFFETDFSYKMNLRALQIAQKNKKDVTELINNVGKALKYFGYSSLKEVSKSDLKRKYHNYLQKVHPDNGGSAAATDELIKNYNILKTSI